MLGGDKPPRHQEVEDLTRQKTEENLDSLAASAIMLDFRPVPDEIDHVPSWGRTGFDFVNTPEAACRGWFVGLVKNRTKK